MLAVVLVAYALLAGVLAGFGLGGRLDRLSSVRLRWAALAVVGFVIQMAIFTEPIGSSVGNAGPALYVGSTVAVLAVVIRNATLTGLPLVAIGAGLNLLAIVANRGYMPADPGALATAGRAASDGYSNSTVLADPALRPLTDIFAAPSALPLANVFSVGDVLIAIGIAVAIAVAMRGRVGSAT